MLYEPINPDKSTSDEPAESLHNDVGGYVESPAVELWSGQQETLYMDDYEARHGRPPPAAHAPYQRGTSVVRRGIRGTPYHAGGIPRHVVYQRTSVYGACARYTTLTRLPAWYAVPHRGERHHQRGTPYHAWRSRVRACTTPPNPRAAYPHPWHTMRCLESRVGLAGKACRGY